MTETDEKAGVRVGGFTMLTPDSTDSNESGFCEGDVCFAPSPPDALQPNAKTISNQEANAMSVKKIAVIGGTGYAGSAIVKEAAGRGHSVVAVSRSKASAPVSGVAYVASPAADAAAAIADADIVVAALSPRGDSLGTLPGIYKQLGRQAAKNNARFVVVGGFTCLRPAPGAPRIIEGGDIPSEYAAEALEMFAVLKELLADETGADWLFVSPGLEFSAVTPGEDLGHYRVGDDVVLLDENGKSAISGVDFARAVIDEIETPTRHRAQIHFAY